MIRLFHSIFFLIYGKNYNTPEKRAELEQDINRLLSLINDFTVKKNYKNFFREKFFQEFRFSGKKIQSNENKKYLLNKNVINTNRITERILVGTIILYPSLLNDISSNFKSINFFNEKFNTLKDAIISLYSKKKTIENLNIRATLLNSEYKVPEGFVLNASVSQPHLLRLQNLHL